MNVILQHPKLIHLAGVAGALVNELERNNASLLEGKHGRECDVTFV